ncbi:TPA: phage tail protein [Klebsiella quasipneumoniae subsp. similipneumoniae]
MNRQIVYPGAIPLETDLLNTNKYSMLGLAKLASSLMGGNTYVHGLACTPSSPPSMVVNVAAGQIYSLQNIDGTAYSSLPADTTHSILKQGYVLDAQQFTLTAPSTSGYSINYLIQATYVDVDGGSTVLPYYNASNPSVAWSGPNNSGTAQYTVRQGVCTVSLKAGVAATTGTQITPSPDSGCVGLYVITVAQGATTVTSANIATYANAPFLPQGGIVDGIQRSTMTYAADTGVANAYVVNINPGILTLSDGMVVNFKAANANTASSTLNVCALGAFPVLNKFGQTLIAGEIASGSHVTVKWSSAASSWFILDSTNAIPTVPTASEGTSTTQSASTAFVASAITAATGRLINIQVFTSSGTYTPSTGTKKIRVTLTGGGGGASGCQGTNTSQTVSGAGGGAGGTAISTITSLSSSYTVTIGAGGSGSSSSASGTAGGNSTFGALIASGGGAGTLSASGATVGGVGGAASGGSINIVGGLGSDGQAVAFVFAGNGGASYWGGGGRAGALGGVAAIAYGAGGGGAYDRTLSGTAYSGGAGKSGICIIEEFA